MDGLGKGVDAGTAPVARIREALWVTRSDVEFLNSLHPRGGVDFPHMGEFIGDRWRLEEAFKVGFLAVSDLWYAKVPDAMDRLHPCGCKSFGVRRIRAVGSLSIPKKRVTRWHANCHTSHRDDLP